MKIDNSFTVDAPPDQVFGYLLDTEQVVGCIPGAKLDDVVDSKTFKGTLKVKVGPVQVTYRGTARMLDVEEQGETSATARVEGEAREVGGQGSVRGSLLLTVAHADGGGSRVDLSADFTVTGRVAQFGRGMIEDVSRRLVGQMASCIQQHLTSGQEASASS
ncbi:MAG TPA: SRPBCC family protein [Candidatus Dormibacteraeota bacterium]|jgi:carbon monoxide dehydrogenase subunit G|nr:SRPBCC family protein [Candidatus Dormibacteraeota bacterium]